MGIAMSYRGKARHIEAIDELITELQNLCQKNGWEYVIVDQEMSVSVSPTWGYGFGYIPTTDQIAEQDIEFFPAMVFNNCNGYFKIFTSRYAEQFRKSFNEGKWPSFSVDTRVKGIRLDIHPRAETVGFLFDLDNLQLCSYQIDPHGFCDFSDLVFCKTRYAGVKVHIILCKVIEMKQIELNYC